MKVISSLTREPLTMNGESATESDSRWAPLLAFPSELPAARPRPAWQLLVMGAVVATVCLVAAQWAQSRWLATPAAVTTGELTIDTHPPGADILIDGQHRGVSP